MNLARSTTTRNSTTRSNAEWRESSCRYVGLVARSPTPRPVSRRCSRQLERLIVTYRVVMIGPIRQELLSGIRTHEQYEGLRERLRAFPDLRLHSQDYELAAQFFDQCRGRGVQGSNTDFLICAAAVRRDSSVFSTDRDFEAYERILQLRRHHVGD